MKNWQRLIKTHVFIIITDYQTHIVCICELNKSNLLNPVPFIGQDYEKQKGPGTIDQSLFRLQKKFKKVPLLAMYYLTMFDDII